MRPALNTWLRVLLTAVVLAAVLWWVDPSTLLDVLSSGETTYILRAVLLMPLNVALAIAVWQYLLRGMQAPISWNDSVRAIMTGYTAALFTPSNIGEAVPRIYVGDRSERPARAAAYLVQALYRIGTHLMAGAAATLVLASVATGTLQQAATLIFPVSAACGIVVVLLALVPGPAAGFLISLPLVRRWRSSLRNHIRIPLRAGLIPFGLSILRYGVYATQFFLLLGAFGVTSNLVERMSGVAFVFFVKAVVPNLFITDLGLREGTAAFVFDSLNSSGPAAVSAALAIYAINLALPAALGVLFATSSRQEKMS